MRFIIPKPSPVLRNSLSSLVMQCSAIVVAILLVSAMVCAGASAQPPAPQATQQPAEKSSHLRPAHRAAKAQSAAPETPPPPPPPDWPANDSPGRASVTWDSHGLRVEASNSSLHQILRDISTQTGTKIEGMGADQRVYGSYGPGQPREVLAQLLQGSGYNMLLAGDLGSGAPRQLVLSPRHSGAASQMASGATPQTNNPDDDTSDNEVEEQPPPPPPPQQPIPMQPNPNPVRPGFGPNGPIRTPQQVMEEMQRQQLLQQQQQQQQEGQPNNPPQ